MKFPFNNQPTPEVLEKVPFVDKNLEKTAESLPDTNVIQALRDVMASGHVNVKTVEQATGMTTKDLMTFLHGKEIDIKADSKEFVTVLQSALDATEEQSDKTLLQKFANSKKAKAIFIAIMLFLKFSGQAQGVASPEAGDKATTNTEKTTDINTEPDDNTYHLTADDLNKNLEKSSDDKEEGDIRVTKLEIANYFDTDSDELTPEAQKEISAKFDDFLLQLKIYPKI